MKIIRISQSRFAAQTAFLVNGVVDVNVRFSRCCSPVPGDEIVGFITRGRGISIHRTDCVNVIALPESEKSRLVDVEWQQESFQF